MAPIIHTSSFLSCRYIVSCFKNNTHDFCIKVVRNLPWNILQCLLGAFAFILSCGSVEPLDPTGIAVWADDCSEIACAVNKADFDGGMFANHETNERYDLVLYDSEGNREGTILSNRKVDGFTSSVESIYYMKSRGYLLVETLMYNCGGRLYEKISLEGENSRLFHLDCEKITDKVKMVPSWLGTFIAMAYFTGSGSATTCEVTFFDSTGLTEVKKIESFNASSSSVVRWQSDSILEVSSNSSLGSIKIMGPDLPLQNSIGHDCMNPATSSSAYCESKGYVTFNGSSQSISFDDSPPTYLRWCR